MKSRRRQSESERRTRNLFSAALLALFMVLVSGTGYLVWDYMHNPRNQPVRSVDIKGKFQYLDRVNLQKVVARVIDGSFFSTDIHKVRDAVLQLPWVEDVSIRRVWPDKLVIQVKERTAIARWGERGLLSDKGQAFRPLKPMKRVLALHLYGKDDDSAEVLAFYRQVKDRVNGTGSEIQRAGMDSRREWRIELRNGMEIVLGNHAPEERLNRFLDVYQFIGKKEMKPVRVDLRYEQGFAVDWSQLDANQQEGET